MDTLEPPGEQKTRQSLVVQLSLVAIVWALIYAVRTAVVIFIASAIVVTPIVLFDSQAAFSAGVILDSSAWGMLLVNAIPPTLGAATFTLVPWGLALLPWALLFQATRSLARRCENKQRDWLIGLGVLLLVYVSVMAITAAVVKSTNVSFSVPMTIFVTLALAASSIVVGALSIYGQKIKVPELLRVVVVRGIGAAFALFGVGALLVALSIISNFADVMTLFNQLNPGYSGFLGLTLLSIGYLPVLAMWALSYSVGAGFSIGPEVLISPFIPVTAPTQLPPFPPLAILPEQAGAGTWLLPLVIIGLGVLWGIGISLRLSTENALMRLVIALGVSVIAALIIMVFAYTSLGNLGDVRLVDLGPTPTLVASLTWLLLSAGMIPTAMLPARVYKRKTRQPHITVVSE